MLPLLKMGSLTGCEWHYKFKLLLYFHYIMYLEHYGTHRYIVLSYVVCIYSNILSFIYICIYVCMYMATHPFSYTPWQARNIYFNSLFLLLYITFFFFFIIFFNKFLLSHVFFNKKIILNCNSLPSIMGKEILHETQIEELY